MTTAVQDELLETLLRRIEQAVRAGDEVLVHQLNALLDEDLTTRNYFFNHFSEYARRQQAGAEEKFWIAEDLGEMAVPADYEYEKIAAVLAAKGAAVSAASNAFKAGERYRVSIVAQKERGTTTIADRLNFLHKQGALHFGAHGIMVALEVFEKKLLASPYKWFSSLDVANMLPRRAGNPYVLLLRKQPLDRFVLEETPLQRSLSENVTFLCIKRVD